MNKAGCELLGYNKKEILFHNFLDFVHPEDREISIKEVMRLEAGETSFQFENRYITKTGDIVWLSWSCTSAEGEGIIYAGAKNITEEKKLRELNLNASLLAKIGSWEVDLKQGKAYWSEITHEIHETNPKTFFPDLSESLDFYREDFRPMIDDLISQSMAKGTPFDFQAVLVTANKNEKWVRVIGKVDIISGISQRIYGSMQDIHEPKSLELQIREILGSISDAFYAVDKDWKFTFFNKKAEQILQRTESEIIGKSLWDEFPSIINTFLEEVYNRVVKNSRPESFEYLRPGDGNWYEINVYPSNGGLSVYFKNINERKQAAEQLLKKKTPS